MYKKLIITICCVFVTNVAVFAYDNEESMYINVYEKLNPAIVSIDAAINPSTNDYFYFVADAKGKVYYNKTASEHERTVADLKSKGLWS